MRPSQCSDSQRFDDVRSESNGYIPNRGQTRIVFSRLVFTTLTVGDAAATYTTVEALVA